MGQTRARPPQSPRTAPPVRARRSTIAAVTGRGVREMGTLLFWQYVFAALSMTIFATAACVLFVPAV